MDITMGQDGMAHRCQSQVEGSLKGGYFESKEPDEHGKPGEIDGFDIDGPGIGGYGVGFDLGAVYKGRLCRRTYPFGCST